MTTEATQVSKLPAVVGIKDICAAFSISRPTLDSWIKAGSFPPGRRMSPSPKARVFWTAAAVAAVLEKRVA